MAEPFNIQIPGLAKMVAQLASLLRSDMAMRQEQSNNAPQASAFDQQAIAAGTFYTIAEAQSNAKRYYQLVLTFDSVSGSGRYRMDGPAPTIATGVPIPAGGVVLTITGADNIKNFSMTPEAGQSLSFARYLFV